MKQAIIITGANSGLGFETTKQIAERNTDYTLIMACRNMAKAKVARADILKSAPDVDIICLEIDTSSLAKVRRFVDAFKRLNMPLYGLVCNAGIGVRNPSRTADGFNNIFETNYLGHFLLTQLLLPFMADDGRIVTVSSERHDTPLQGATWPGAAALARTGENRSLDRASYAFSKLCMVMFAYELDRRLTRAGKHIAVNTVNPGLMLETNFTKIKSRFPQKVMARFAPIAGTAKDSGRMIVDLMLEPQFAKGPTRYFDRSSAKPVASSKLSYDQHAQADLWDYSMQTVGIAK